MGSLVFLRAAAALRAFVTVGLVTAGCGGSTPTPAAGDRTDATAPAAAPPSTHRLVPQVRFAMFDGPSPDGLLLAGHAVVDGRTNTTVDAFDARVSWTPDGRLLAAGRQAVTLVDPSTGRSVTGPRAPLGAPLVTVLRLGASDHLVWFDGGGADLRPLASPGPSIRIALARPNAVRALGPGGWVVSGEGGVAASRLDGSAIFREPQAAKIDSGPEALGVLLGGRRVRALTGEVLHELGGPGVLDPTGARVAFADAATVGVHDLRTRTLSTVTAPTARALAWDAAGARLAFVDAADQIAVWTPPEPKARVWGSIPRARSLQLVGDHVFVDAFETVALGPAGEVARTRAHGCRFASRAARPLVGICNLRQKLVRFDGASFQEEPWQRAVVDAAYDRWRGLRVSGWRTCTDAARVIGPSGPVAEATAAAAIAQPAPWEGEGETHVAASGAVLSVVTTRTGVVRATFEAALGEPIAGVGSDGGDGAIVWGVGAVARRGAAGTPAWRVAVAHVTRARLVGGRVVVERLDPATRSGNHPSGEPGFTVLDLHTGATLASVDDATVVATFRRTMVVYTRWKHDVYDVHDLAYRDALLTDADETNGEWVIRDRHESVDDHVMRGFELRSVAGFDHGGRFDGPSMATRFSADGALLVVQTNEAQLVVLRVPRADDVVETREEDSLRQLARVDAPVGFQLERLIGTDVAQGKVMGAPVFVRLDDGRRLRVSASSAGGPCRVVVHDDHLFTGDLDGPVLVRRGGTLLAPDLAPLAAVTAAHRPALVREFFTAADRGRSPADAR